MRGRPRIYTPEEALERKKAATKLCYLKNIEKYTETQKLKREGQCVAKQIPLPKPRVKKVIQVPHQCEHIYIGTTIQCSRKIKTGDSKSCWQHSKLESSLGEPDESSPEPQVEEVLKLSDHIKKVRSKKSKGPTIEDL